MSSFASSIKSLPGPIVSFGDLLLDKLDHYGENSFIIDAVSGQRQSYCEMASCIRSLTASFVKKGYRKGDTLIMYCKNRPDYLTVVGGTACAHLTLSTANPAYTPSELAYQLNDSRSCAIITTQDLFQNVLDAITYNHGGGRCSSIREIFILDSHDITTCNHSNPPNGIKVTLFSSLLCETQLVTPETTIDVMVDVFLLPYSSGTTGKPKGVMLTHSNMVSNVLQYAAHPRLINADTNSTFIAVLPMFHIYGLYIFLMCAPYVGANLVVLPHFDPQLLLRSIEKYRVTTFYMAPPIALFLAQHPSVTSHDLSSIMDIKCGAAPLKQELQQQLYDRLDPTGHRLVLRQGWGMTELSPLATITGYYDAGIAGYGTVGQVLPATQAKIIPLQDANNTAAFVGDTNQTPVELGTEGELWVRGPQVMLGYFNNDEATNNTMTPDGWLMTGDVAVANERGFFYITDRVKELIKTKGFQVAPAELEGLLLSHPAVQDCCVFGVPDERAGEIPRAAVVLNPNQSVSEKVLVRFIEGRVAPYKELSGGVKFVDAIPKTASGKILRRLLRTKLL